MLVSKEQGEVGQIRRPWLMAVGRGGASWFSDKASSVPTACDGWRKEIRGPIVKPPAHQTSSSRM